MFRFTAFVAVALTLLLAPDARADAGWRWPVRGPVLTSYANGSDPYAAGQHRGIDIGADAGTAVVAAVGGQVRYAGTLGSSGIVVSVRTGDGRYDTSYLHLSSVAVRKGQSVGAGERLGAVGTTGTRSVAAAHLHFGVRDAGQRHAYHDPMDFLPAVPAAPDPAPRAAPAPVGAPQPVAPAPAPVARALRWGGRDPVPAMRPARLPAPVARPGLASAPVGHGPRSAPSAVPALVSHARLRSGSGARAPAHHDAHSPVSVSEPGLGPAAEPSREAGRAPVPHTPSRPEVSAGHASRLGWVLAAIGLLVAAACVRPAATRRGASRVGTRMRAWMRPVPE